jgi:glycosyltransferase involved in cell wall biosynthesis
MKSLTIVIPNKEGENPMITLESLYKQEFNDFDVIIVNDQNENANIARNYGFSLVKTNYVLFCDNDIEWMPEAIGIMYQQLEKHPDISYAYGPYIYKDNASIPIQCCDQWDASKLRRNNYISTMSMIRSDHFPGFDPAIRRFQDWDLWLTMLEQGHYGKNINRLAFCTYMRTGITYGGQIDIDEALRAVMEKHKLYRHL